MLVAGGLFDVILAMLGGGNQDGVMLRFVSAMTPGRINMGPGGWRTRLVGRFMLAGDPTKQLDIQNQVVGHVFKNLLNLQYLAI